MLLKKTNIEHVLQRIRNHKSDLEMMVQVHEILTNHVSSQKRIKDTIANPKLKVRNNDFVFDNLETDRIFHIEQIKETCIEYRLRFLDSRYFKGKIPRSALQKIEKLEKLHDTELKGFKIMAPSKLFKLADKDDPLLFAPISNDYYYLIHKWGNDLHPLRKLLVWPFKNIVNLALVVFIFSYIATLLVPQGLFSKSGGSSEFWIVFFFMFKCIASVVIFYGFALGKNFNPAIWNSKYFNA